MSLQLVFVTPFLKDGGLYDKLYLSLYFCVSELAQCNYRPTADTQGVTGASKQLM